MKEHRDSPEIEPEEASNGRMNPSRRFARLVESPAARRVALPKLLAGGGIVLLLGWLLWISVTKSLQSTDDLVSSQPDQKIPFARIELIPEPPLYIRSGAAGILEDVRVREKYDRILSLYRLDLKELTNGFKHCPWVREVVRIDSAHGHLEVHLVYRKPVAVVEIGQKQAQAIDGEIVPLAHMDIDWISSDKAPFRVQGIPDPLIQLCRVEPRPNPKVGVPWVGPVKAGSTDPGDSMFQAAARLAEFLQRQPKSTPLGRKAPTFVSLWLPDEPDGPFLLEDSEKNWVLWGEPPGEERPGDPSGEDRWRMLLDWIDRHEGLQAQWTNRLYFTRSGAERLVGKGSSKPH